MVGTGAWLVADALSLPPPQAATHSGKVSKANLMTVAILMHILPARADVASRILGVGSVARCEEL
jgi:hypothetical protein